MKLQNKFKRAISAAISCTVLMSMAVGTAGQRRRINDKPKTSHSRNVLSPEAKEIVELASVAVCRERITDPKASVPIDDMQTRPSLPVQSPEALAGARRAERLLPITKQLVIVTLKQLANEYEVRGRGPQALRFQRAINRVMAVRHIRADMDSRDNASVFLQNPRVIIFGTIFLAGLPSDEGIISVLSHELVHIADGDEDSLAGLFLAVGSRASQLTTLKIQQQRAEELTSDLVGMMAARAYVSREPNYEPLPRRISRSLAHNCVEQDEGDEDHLSPRNTIRALLALNISLSREIVYGR